MKGGHIVDTFSNLTWYVSDWLFIMLQHKRKKLQVTA